MSVHERRGSVVLHSQEGWRRLQSGVSGKIVGLHGVVLGIGVCSVENEEAILVIAVLPCRRRGGGVR